MKEARETLYWIEVIVESQVATEQKFTLLKEECNRIIKILVSSINSLKGNS